MKVKAKLNNLRVSPRKVRLVANLVRGLDVANAKTQLNFLIKRSSTPMLKLLNSAVANAKHNFELEESNLYISELFVCEGPTLKRIMPRAMGRAFHIRKRTSHITLVLEEKSVGNKVEDKIEKKKKSEEKPVKKPAEKTVKKDTKEDKKSEEKPVKKAEKSESKDVISKKQK